MEFKIKNTGINPVAIIYFLVALVEILSEFFTYTPLIYIFKPMMPLLLILLYWTSSDRRNPMFVVVLFFSVLTNLLFIPDTPQMLLYGLIAFMIHRILAIYYIIVLLKIKDYIPVIISTIPFLLIFFYMFFITEGIPENSFIVLIFQNILIAVFCGIAFSHYIMNDNRKNSWLLLCGVLFGSLQFIVFIEKFYLSGFSPVIFRPIAMGLNAFAFYTFYEFVLATEKSDSNGTPEGRL